MSKLSFIGFPSQVTITESYVNFPAQVPNIKSYVADPNPSVQAYIGVPDTVRDSFIGFMAAIASGSYVAVPVKRADGCGWCVRRGRIFDNTFDETFI